MADGRIHGGSPAVVVLSWNGGPMAGSASAPCDGAFGLCRILRYQGGCHPHGANLNLQAGPFIARRMLFF
jgi:hypothetical protein